MPITENVTTTRSVLSAVGPNGEGKCKFGCRYCFAAEAEYIPNSSVRSPETIQILRERKSDYEVVMLSCDTELFQNPKLALDTLKEVSSLGKDVTFSTKMILGPRLLDEICKVQESLVRHGNILSVSISIPMFDKSKEIEIGVPSPERRISFLKTLKDLGLGPFVGVRPLLPPNLVTNEEIGRIVDKTIENSYGYIIGPYWFKTDKFSLLDDKSLPVFQRKVQWMEDDQPWYVYEDKEREQKIADVIKNRDGILYERSSEALIAIKKAILT